MSPPRASMWACSHWQWVDCELKFFSGCPWMKTQNEISPLKRSYTELSSGSQRQISDVASCKQRFVKTLLYYFRLSQISTHVLPHLPADKTDILSWTNPLKGYSHVLGTYNIFTLVSNRKKHLIFLPYADFKQQNVKLYKYCFFLDMSIAPREQA